MISMNCSRCRRSFRTGELDDVWIVWRVLAFPILVLKVPLRREANAAYCRGCRRIVNLCFGVVAFFCVTVFGGGLVTRLILLMAGDR